MKPTPSIAKSPFDGLFLREPCPVDWAFGVDGEVYREMDGRRTKRIDLEGRSYFVKTYAGATVKERLKNWMTFKGACASAAGEVRAHCAADAAAVPVPRLVAAGSRGRRSFIVTEDVGTQATIGGRLDELVAMEPRVRHALIEAVGALIGRLHGAGIHHRDCYLVHIALTGAPPAGLPLCLMDLHRAGVRGRIPMRWLAKDLGGLLFSAEAAKLTRVDLRRFGRAYAQAGGTPSDRLWRQARGRAESLVQERARRGARFGR